MTKEQISLVKMDNGILYIHALYWQRANYKGSLVLE